jgi:hypothetical protein
MAGPYFLGKGVVGGFVQAQCPHIEDLTNTYIGCNIVPIRYPSREYVAVEVQI